jgi:hypothetical protein
MSNTIYNHYVYRITNILLNKHYYGSRSCKCQPKNDLGIKYFSSSLDKDFIKDQKKHPEHYLYKIIRICENRKDAYKLEIKLHEKFDVGINESFYNRCKATSTRFSYDPTGKKLSKEHRKKMSDARKGKYVGENSPNYGKHLSEKTRNKLSELKKGENNYRFEGYYVTPFGTFSSSIDHQIKENNINHKSIINWCKTNNDKIISKMSYAKSKYLQENFDESIIGKTFADIGFLFKNV